jgi:hypothetical protein
LIDKFADNADKESERDYADEKDQRKYMLWIVFPCLVFFAFLVWFLTIQGQPQLIEKIVIGVGSFIAGAIGGFGYCKSKQHS